MSSEYKLTYYDLRWDTEPIRLLFTFAKVPFQDIRLPFKIKDGEWPTREDFQNQIPPEISEKLLFDKLPFLEFDGNILTYAPTISRFLAKRFGLYGSNHEEAARIDEILDAAKDYGDSFESITLAKSEEEKKEAVKNVVEILTPKYMGRFNKIVEENGTGYLVGTKMSLADLQIFNVTTYSNGIPNEFVKNYPGLLSLVNKIREIPEIQKWIQDRPKSSF